MTLPSSTSPLSMRGTAAAGKTQQQRGGFFKRWKNSSNNNRPSESAVADPSSSLQRSRVAIDPRQEQLHQRGSHWHDDSHEQQQRHIHHSLSPQFEPSNNYSDGEYYHCCNDELSRQLHLAAQLDQRQNEEKQLAKFKFRQEHCQPLNKDLMTQSTQATKDTSSSISSSPNTSTVGNINNSRRNPVTAALSTATQVFRQQNHLIHENHIRFNNNREATSGAVGASANVRKRDNEEKAPHQIFVQSDWKIMSEDHHRDDGLVLFDQCDNNDAWPDGDDFDNDDDDYYDHAKADDGNNATMQQHWRDAVDHNTGKTYYYNKMTKEVSWTKPNESSSSSNRNNNKTPPPPPEPPITSHWREAVDPNSGKTYYYNKMTNEVSWSKPKDNERGTINNTLTPPPPPPPPPPSELRPPSNNDAIIAAAITNSAMNNMITINHRDNTISSSTQQQRQMQRRRHVKSPPRTRASPSLDSIAEDDNEDVMSPPPAAPAQKQKQQQSRARSKSPFRSIVSSLVTTAARSSPSQSHSPILLRHASSSFQSDPNRGGDANAAYDDDDDNDDGRSRKKKLRAPIVNRMPSSSLQKQGGKGSSSMMAVEDVVSLVSYHDDPSIGVLSSLDDMTLSSRSFSRRSSSVVVASTTSPTTIKGGGGDCDVIDRKNKKKHADPPGNSIDEILKQGLSNNSRERSHQQQQQQPDGYSPYRERQQQQRGKQSPYQQHQSNYSELQLQPKQPQRSVHHKQQQQQQQQTSINLTSCSLFGPYNMDERQDQQRSPYSEQQYKRYSHSEHVQHQQHQHQIYEDEDGNQWMVTSDEEVRSNHRWPQSHGYHRQKQQHHRHRRREQYDDGHQQTQQQQDLVPPPPPGQGWQWSEQQELRDYPTEEYFDDENGNFISFITPDPKDGDYHHVVVDYDSIGMLTEDGEGPPLGEGGPNGAADDDTAANTLATSDLVAEVKRVWRHVQRYEQRKSKNDVRKIEKKSSEEEILVHQFSQALSKATPSLTMNKSSAVGETSSKRSNNIPNDVAKISPEKEVVSSSSRGRSLSKDSRLGDHIRSTSVHSRAHSSRGEESPTMGSDHAMMSRGSTEMDGEFISEGIDSFFVSQGMPSKSTLHQQAHQKKHLLHPSQVAAAQKLIQNNRAAISASKVPAASGQQQQQQKYDLQIPYDFKNVKSTGTHASAKTQTISNTTNFNAMKGHKLEMARKQKQLQQDQRQSLSPPRPPAVSRKNNTETLQQQQQQQQEEQQQVKEKEEGHVSPGLLYARALQNAKDRKFQKPK